MNVQWDSIALQLSKAKQTRKYYEEVERKLLEDLKQLSGNQSQKGDKFELKATFRLGSIDYSRVPELIDVDLSKYRKPPTTMWTLIENMVLPENIENLSEVI
jgi:hypothetical protein